MHASRVEIHLLQDQNVRLHADKEVCLLDAGSGRTVWKEQAATREARAVRQNYGPALAERVTAV